MSDLVSIVVPAFDVEQYLPLCMDALLRQTYRDLDIVLVDDGSRDGTGRLCDEYARLDERVSVVHQSNRGLSAARNVGTAAASGPWLVYVDSDDVVHPRFVAALLDAARRHDADCALCPAMTVRGGGTVPEARWPLPKPVGADVLDARSAVGELLSERRASTAAWAKLAKTSIWRRFVFPEGRRFEDLPVSWKVLAASERIALLDAPLYGYRQRERSISSVGSASAQSVQDYLTSIMQARREIADSPLGGSLRRELAFRTGLECCRLITMCRAGGRDEPRIGRVETQARLLLRASLREAVGNGRASAVQRARLALTALSPALADRVMRAVVA